MDTHTGRRGKLSSVRDAQEKGRCPLAQLTIFGVLFGSILGSRYNVLSLVLAIGVTVAGILFDGVARQIDIWALAGEISLVCASLQGGYLVGAAVAFLVDLQPGSLFRRGRSRAQ